MNKITRVMVELEDKSVHWISFEKFIQQVWLNHFKKYYRDYDPSTKKATVDDSKS